MAVIILSTADFSANNIGHIDLFTGFHQTTLDLFNDFNITPDVENTMQIAVDDFVRKLIGAGIWGNDKINGLCLPFLTNLSSTPNLDDAVLNCINREQKFFDDSYSDKLELIRNGVVTKRTGENRLAINVATFSWATAQNLHFASFSLEDEPTEYRSSEQTEIANKFIATLNPMLGLQTDRTLTVTPSNRAYGDSNYSNKACMNIVCYNPLYHGSKVALYIENQQALTINVYTTESQLSAWYFGKYQSPYLSANNYPVDTNPNNPGGNGQIKAPYGLLSVGKYLTAEEVSIYNNAAHTLIEAVHQYMN